MEQLQLQLDVLRQIFQAKQDQLKDPNHPVWQAYDNLSALNPNHPTSSRHI